MNVLIGKLKKLRNTNEQFQLMNISLAQYYLIQNIKMSQTILSALHWTFNEVFTDINIRQKNAVH